ncbi:hypothetical protein N9E48_10780 [Paracoccaceae bacterium]|nr:hypothetical protein [Paracoccaceae bacterium]
MDRSEGIELEFTFNRCNTAAVIALAVYAVTRIVVRGRPRNNKTAIGKAGY